MRADPTGPRGTPLDPSHAVLALEDASDREEVFEILLRATRSRTRFAVLLSVHADELRGRRALGDGVLPFQAAQIEASRVPRNQVPAFEQAIALRTPQVGPIATGEAFIDGFLEQLGGPTPAALVLPVVIGTRTVALIVAHRGADATLTGADCADLFPLIAASGIALGRVLAARQKAAPAPALVRDQPGYAEIEVVMPSAAKRRATLADLRGSGAWEEAADGIRDLIREGMEHGDPDEDEQLELLLELGTIEADRLGRPQQAIEAWKSAQTIDAGDPRVLDALQAVFVQQGMWAECADIIEKRVALADEPASRILLLLELAAIAHDRLEDDERAIAAYERILNWEPEHELATRQLEEVYSSRQQWEPLAALLLDRASRQKDPEQAIAALGAVAAMYEDKVGDMRAAFLVWLAVFRRAPERPHLLDQLERLGPLANAWDEVLAEGTALAEELEAAHPAAAKDVWQLVGTWMRDHARNRAEAAHAFDRALQLGPSDRTTVQDLTELLRADARWADLTAVLLKRADAETDPEGRAALLVELGALYEHELGSPGDAIACYERARVDEPEARAALDGLHRLYRQTGAWQQLVELIPHLIDVRDPTTERSEMLDLHCERGDVLADFLNRPDDAIAAFNAALALDQKYAAAFAGISRVYRATGQTEQLLDATEAELDAGGREMQLKRYGEIAAAWHQRGRFDRAIACWQKLLAIDPENLGAHAGLVASLRGNEQWGSLVTALRAQLDRLRGPANQSGNVINAPGDRVALLLELADLLATQLDDVDGAIAAYQAVLAIDKDHRASLDALGRLYDRAGQLQPALTALNRLLELTTTEPRVRADLFARIGHLHLNARDADNARLHLKQALALDLENATAHEAMGRLHLMQDELVAAGEELVRAAQLAREPADKLRCLADAAWVFRHRLHDTERARQCLHLILDLEPENADAKQALAELLHDTKQWETLWPHLEQEVARAKSDAALAPKDKCDIYLRAARCALELDRFATAMELYDAACAIDPAPAHQIERANALYRSKDLDAAAAAYQTIVMRHAQGIERPQMIAVYQRLAELQTALGKPAQAQLFHQKVLDLEPRNRETLRELADLHQSRGRFDEAIASLRSLLEVTPEAERVTVLERIGDLYRDKVKNPPRAMSTYLEALEIDSANRRLLQRVLDLQSEAGQWKSAVETIGRFLAHETDPHRRGAYFIASAEIRRSELRDKAGALDDYEHALDELLREAPLSAPTRTRAFDVFTIVDELVTADKNWKYQEQAYRRMIKRMPQGDPALIALWHALGEVYRTRLKHFKSAIEAFEVAHSLDPAKPTARASILAELYALLGSDASQVSRRAAKLVATDPTHPDAYRALGRTSLEAGRIDQAWCVARALVFVKQATPDEQALYKRYQSHEVTKATGILDDDAWAFVRSPEEERTISSIFSLIWEGPVALRAGPPKAFELKPKDRLPIEDATRVIAKIFRHAARVLNVALPDVYVQPRRSGRLLLANCIEKGRLVPAVIVGRDLMTGYRDTELAAAVGAMLALLRPAYYLKLALTGVDELEAALGAAAALVGRPGIGRPQLEPMRQTFAAEIGKRLSQSAGETLHALVQRISDRPDLAKWRAAVDTAAQRAGLLVAGELGAAARMLSTESAISGARPSQRIQDLVSYSVSPEYFAARVHLGIAIG